MSWGRKSSYRSYRAQCTRAAARNARKRARRERRIALAGVNAAHAPLWRQLFRWLGCLGLVAAIVILAARSAHGGEPDQWARWQSAKIDPRRTVELDKLVVRYQRTAAMYKTVEAMRANGVPAPVAFALFYREADNDMAESPAQGDPLTHRSVNEPRGRIPGRTPPFAWADAAFDAYYVVDHLDRTDWHDTQSSLNKIESFNGFGYRRYNVPSPYLWGGTSLYGAPGGGRGKYVSDGRFDPIAVDHQLGVAAILMRLRERGLKLTF